MSYQALYRVWRPQTFIDVVGQEHVTKTLQNALLQQKISHAYLFSGPRGTGKTSAAKILAKAINCEHAPTAEPCNECAACRGITDGTISDVLEFDAASNSRVEEMRDVLDKVKFAPTSVNYKVYIIDEVHMLSISAFNALLKTLEEPPKHVIFILATTEPHKIPLTIISRCQRFDFRRITASSIVNRMKLIVEESGIACDEPALQMIARAAEGGMRDALSLLDQAISYSQDRVTLEDALTVTGAVSQGFLNKIAAAFREKDVASGLESLHELLYHGKDPARFIEDLILFYRDMLLYKTAPKLEESLERVMLDDEFRNLAESTPAEQIYDLIDLLNKTQQEMRWTNHPRIFLEVAIVKLCQMEQRPEMQTAAPKETGQLISRIEMLEAELRHLKENGLVSTGQEPASQQQKQAHRPTKRAFQPATGKINEVLKQATKGDLNIIKANWGEMRAGLLKSHAALINEAEPVAASPNAFILKFKHEIHCQMAMDKHDFIEAVTASLYKLTGRRLMLLGVPEEQWPSIREEFLSHHGGSEEGNVAEQEEELHIAEAKKLFGAEFVEIID